MLKIKAIVKNIAPPKQGVKIGLVKLAVQPIAQALFLNQFASSIVKFAQANKVPASKTINCVIAIFFILLYYIQKPPSYQGRFLDNLYGSGVNGNPNFC